MACRRSGKPIRIHPSGKLSHRCHWNSFGIGLSRPLTEDRPAFPPSAPLSSRRSSLVYNTRRFLQRVFFFFCTDKLTAPNTEILTAATRNGKPEAEIWDKQLKINHSSLAVPPSSVKISRSVIAETTPTLGGCERNETPVTVPSTRYQWHVSKGSSISSASSSWGVWLQPRTARPRTAGNRCSLR